MGSLSRPPSAAYNDADDDYNDCGDGVNGGGEAMERRWRRRHDRSESTVDEFLSIWKRTPTPTTDTAQEPRASTTPPSSSIRPSRLCNASHTHTHSITYATLFMLSGGAQQHVPTHHDDMMAIMCACATHSLDGNSLMGSRGRKRGTGTGAVEAKSELPQSTQPPININKSVYAMLLACGMCDDMMRRDIDKTGSIAGTLPQMMGG